MSIINIRSQIWRLGLFNLAILQASYAEVATSIITQTTLPCANVYFAQTQPKITNKKYANDTIDLCFDGFAVKYSGVSKTALWSAELLTRDKIQQASQLERINKFHAESRLPNSIKAQLSDYSHSPYDRGHLAPNADMATPTQQYDSFSLANIIPQNPQHNRNLWKDIEFHTRYLAIKYGQVYVITGVVFLGDNVKQMNQRILVPTHLYKAIYVPSQQQAGVYFTPNDDSQRVEVISLTELNRRVGVNVFPELSTTIKSNTMSLPTTSKKPPVTRSNDEQDITPSKIAVLLVNLFWAIVQWIDSVLKN